MACAAVKFFLINANESQHRQEAQTVNSDERGTWSDHEIKQKKEEVRKEKDYGNYLCSSSDMISKTSNLEIECMIVQV